MSEQLGTFLDNSSGATPVGNTWRGVGSSWFNANNVAKEDWLRDQQAADLDVQRSVLAERELRKTAYSDTVESLQKAGLNPILAYQNGVASVSAPSVSSSRSSSSSKSPDPLGSILKFAAGLLTVGLGFGLKAKKFKVGF